MSDEHKDPEQLEAEVEAARARVGRTVDQLSTKLSPGELLDQVMGMTSEHGGEFAKNLGRQIKANPLALLVTGVGMTWLAAGNRSNVRDQYDTAGSSSYELGSDAGNAGGVADKVKGAVSTAGDKVQAAKSSAAESLQSGKEQALNQAQALQSQLHSTLQEQPLVVGGLGIALGAALGALLPPSDTENQLFGTVSDQAIEKASDVASEQYETLREKAKGLADDVKQSVDRQT